MIVPIDITTSDGYRKFLAIKQLPTYRFIGRTAEVPDEYADRLGAAPEVSGSCGEYRPISGLFDYQRDIAALAIRKRKFAIFAECGLGKTLIARTAICGPGIGSGEITGYARGLPDQVPGARRQ
jgi:hypothetical protein